MPPQRATRATTAAAATPPLAAVLPPLIFGTATFNAQYNKDPYALDTVGLVAEALKLGIRAFDTSPYYGPSETLLGAALDTSFVRETFPRSDYFIITKCGRIAAEEFDYSPEWVRQSVARSLDRLRTEYLDVVYCHDVEFVSPQEVLGAVRELRRIRDEEGTVKYVGISGYPVHVLCELAQLVLNETGEPLDVVMSYANFTLQNSILASEGLARLRAARVDVVANASLLGMGLLRHDGLPVGSLGDWHPAPPGLREAVTRARDFVGHYSERLEVIALRYSLETWLEVASPVGSHGDPASGVPFTRESNQAVGGRKLGVSVIGVSNLSELTRTMEVWRSILDGLEDGQETAKKAGRWDRDHEWSLNRRKAVEIMAAGVKETLGPWMDFAWDSPSPGFVNLRHKKVEEEEEVQGRCPRDGPWPTPSPEPMPELEKELPLR